MIFERPNPEQILLQVIAQNLDGSPKVALSSASVRVYYVNFAGTEVEELSSTMLTQVDLTNTWRYVWEPGSLDAGQYVAEYSLTDTDGILFIGTENICIQDFSQESTLAALNTNIAAIKTDVTLIKKIETGSWKIDTATNRMIFYDEDLVTPLFVFDLKDIDGLPNYVNIFERVPV